VRHKAEAVAQIDAAMIAATCPGSTVGDVFRKTQAAYASAGFPDEWQFHHQGGLAGYEPREIIVVGEQTNEILTDMTDWPAIEVQIGDQRIKRPAILEME
jgi:antitoxin VapB